LPQSTSMAALAVAYPGGFVEGRVRVGGDARAVGHGVRRRRWPHRPWPSRRAALAAVACPSTRSAHRQLRLLRLLALALAGTTSCHGR
jgi:hypothetical protein